MSAAPPLGRVSAGVGGLDFEQVSGSDLTLHARLETCVTKTPSLFKVSVGILYRRS